jgi:hypothetical protein
MSNLRKLFNDKVLKNLLLCSRLAVTRWSQRLEQHDAALVTGPTQLKFTAPPDGPGAHVLLIEMAAAA